MIYAATVEIVCEDCQDHATLTLDALGTARIESIHMRFEALGWLIKDNGETFCPECAKKGASK